MIGMSLSRSDPTESSILSCSSEEYWDVFSNESLPTKALADDVLYKFIGPLSEMLRRADKKYKFDKLLSAML